MPNASVLEDRGSLLRGLGLEPEPEPPQVRLSRTEDGPYRIDAVRPAMGTRVCVTAFGRSAARLEEAVGRAFEEMDRLIAIFSRHERDSAISVLNDAGRLAHPPRELADLLDRAHRFHALSRGAFDVSVAPLVDLLRARLGGPSCLGPPPSAAEIAAVRAVVGARHITSTRRLVLLERSGMRLTLDGIAKGYIVDRMAAALETHRVRHSLIDGGGDIRISGRKPRGLPWTVAVRDPADPSSFLDVVRPGPGAVATSGSYEHFYDVDRRFHHLVDGATGLSPGQVTSVSVRAPSAMAADALATAVFVMGPVAGLALVDSLAGCACLILDRDGRRLITRGWKTTPPVPDTTG